MDAEDAQHSEERQGDPSSLATHASVNENNFSSGNATHETHGTNGNEMDASHVTADDNQPDNSSETDKAEGVDLVIMDPELAKQVQEHGFSASDLPKNFVANLNKAKDFAVAWQQRYLLQRQQQSQLQAIQESANIARNVALCARIYVGSIIFELTREDIIKVFEVYGSIKNVDMSFDPITGKHKGFCFIEYETPEGASSAMAALNGAVLGGRNLKLGRPNNYPTEPNAGLPFPYPERIYVSNIHEDISESDITGVFEAFGKIVQCSLIPDPTTRKHKTYGYIQYENASSAESAITGMNGFDLGGRRLVVAKTVMGGAMLPGMSQMPLLIASTPLVISPPKAQLATLASAPAVVPPAVSAAVEKAAAKAAEINIPSAKPATDPAVAALPTATAITLAAANASLAVPKPNEQDTLLDENVSISGRQRFEVMQRLAARTENSKTVVFRDMVSPDEVDDDLEDEVRSECSKYGTVQKVVVHLDRNEDGVKIFVHFSKHEEAAKAHQVFDGRWFGGHRIRSQMYDDTRFSAGDYSG